MLACENLKDVGWKIDVFLLKSRKSSALDVNKNWMESSSGCSCLNCKITEKMDFRHLSDDRSRLSCLGFRKKTLNK